MDGFFASGHAADVVLAVLIAEGVFLCARGMKLRPVLLMQLPAGLIVIGLRAALVGAAWPWIALPLALAFPAHLADLAERSRPRR